MANVKIIPSLNGPYIVKGPIELTDPHGRSWRLDKETTALCRCGQSGNKPFCDGTHAKCGFQADTQAPPA